MLKMRKFIHTTGMGSVGTFFLLPYPYGGKRIEDSLTGCNVRVSRDINKRWVWPVIFRQ
jgi:hypothetical protein